MKAVASCTLLFAALFAYGCTVSSNDFPEDRVIHESLAIDTQWQTLEFDRPLELNRAGLQRFHIVVDDELFDPNHAHDLSDSGRYFDIFRKSDEVVISPEVVLVDNQGKEIKLTATGSTDLYEGGLSINFGMFTSSREAIPPYPEDSEHFVAAKVRSNVPFQAEYFRWQVDRHPDSAK